ncbi:energy-coupling factor transporter transmembrane component T [Methanothermobacter sp.]|uniref:energy-coupling factor transporter transmembrane component T family protein n=1 Tax=Methanothermobacter sp. TaxID=1884223 RepID=UPI002618EE31|nr:energy-coupling factor transporter transmembrane component T [Methanothermobacter sp.]MDI9614588.1 energy-coupling factor transporter transmembrane component T [Methanothermobacter sp.]
MIEYINSDSIIHKLNPFTKFLFSLIVLTASIITSSVWILASLITVSIICWLTARIPLKNFKVLLIVIVAMIVIGTLTQSLFFTEKPGYTGTKTVLFNIIPYDLPVIGALPITLEGLKYGIIFSMRMTAIVISSLLLPITTHPTEIILMLKRMKFPEWLILVITMSIRFLPMSIQNFNTMRNAQRLRKGRLELKDLLLLLESLIIISVLTAKKMALSLEIKAFGHSKKRTSFKTLQFRFRDLIFTLFSITILFIALLDRWWS